MNGQRAFFRPRGTLSRPGLLLWHDAKTSAAGKPTPAVPLPAIAEIVVIRVQATTGPPRGGWFTCPGPPHDIGLRTQKASGWGCSTPQRRAG